MQSGIVYGYSCMLDGMIDRFEAELGRKCTVVATGGLSKFFCDNMRREVISDENLMLEGLYILYKKNYTKEA